MTENTENSKGWKSLTKSEKTISIVSFLIVALLAYGVITVITGIGNAKIFSNNSDKSTKNSQQTTSAEKVNDTQAPQKEYKDLATLLSGDIAAKKHYLYTASSKPSYDEVKAFVVEEVKRGCGDGRTVCDYFLWDDESAYSKAVYGSDDLLSGTATEIATKNMDHLAGFINSGYMFFYYGTTGNGSSDSATIYDNSTEEFVNF